MNMGKVENTNNLVMIVGARWNKFMTNGTDVLHNLSNKKYFMHLR
jgi:hypothetical protein